MPVFKIKDIADEISIRVDNPKTSGYDIFVGLEHYDSGKPVITRYGSTAKLDSGAKVFESGDILIARRNVYLKRAGLVNFKGLTSGDSIVIRAKNIRIQKLLPFIFNTSKFWDYASMHADGSMSKRLSPKNLMEFEVNLPSDSTDLEKLSNLLWSMYDSMCSYEDVMAKSDELIKSQFIEMFEGKYNKKPIKFFIDTNIISVKKRFNLNDTIRYVDIASVDNLRNTVTSYTEYVVKNAPSRAQQCILNGDILVSLVRPNLKNIAIFSKKGDDYVASSGFCVLRSLKASSRYLLQCVLDDSFTREMVNLTNGANYPAVRNSDVLNYLIFDAPIEKQVGFNEIANQIDKSKFEIEKSLDNLKKMYEKVLRENF